EKGMNMLTNSIDKLDANIGQKLSAKDAFKLCDTYGFPFELVKDIVLERNVGVDEEGFFALMREQQERARNAAHSENEGWAKTDITLKEPPTNFVGYENIESDAKILHIFNDEKETDEAIQNQKVSFIFDQTPLYAEGGGQISDHGVLIKDDCVANITDCQKLK
ncbi:MAG: alanine--tRNA ligase, partial [Oscillospiraceae bacterium]|nr:alanine--tRNA ligase [Oscillospiraceae bacterium]